MIRGAAKMPFSWESEKKVEKTDKMPPYTIKNDLLGIGASASVLYGIADSFYLGLSGGYNFANGKKTIEFIQEDIKDHLKLPLLQEKEDWVIEQLHLAAKENEAKDNKDPVLQEIYRDYQDGKTDEESTQKRQESNKALDKFKNIHKFKKLDDDKKELKLDNAYQEYSDKYDEDTKHIHVYDIIPTWHADLKVGYYIYESGPISFILEGTGGFHGAKEQISIKDKDRKDVKKPKGYDGESRLGYSLGANMIATYNLDVVELFGSVGYKFSDLIEKDPDNKKESDEHLDNFKKTTVAKTTTRHNILCTLGLQKKL